MVVMALVCRVALAESTSVHSSRKSRIPIAIFSACKLPVSRPVERLGDIPGACAP
jgi:hypothetical protein